MKKIMFVFVVIISLMLFSSKVKAYPTLTLEVLDPLIYPGETFEVNVVVDGVTDVDPILGPDELLAFGFDVVYPASFVFNGATVGPSFFDDSALFPNTDVAGSTFPGISGDDILLATLSFTPSVTGTFTLGIFSDISDPNEGLFTWLYPQIDITNSVDVNVVPEPATLLLVGAGIVGLGVIRKKIK